MTEDDARGWIADRFGAAAVDRIATFLAGVIAENGHQNLIAPSTVADIWVRHALDSAQLVPLALPGLWVDIGTGGGFPGMVVALLREDPVILVEPRRRRAEFLMATIDQLGIGAKVSVEQRRIETLAVGAGTISARAVASVGNLLHAAAGCATPATRWLLPRGRFDGADMAPLRQRWEFMFHVEHSITDPASSILVLDKVRPR